VQNQSAIMILPKDKDSKCNLITKSLYTMDKDRITSDLLMIH